MAVVEREEGLFTRHGATRMLCILALLGGLVAGAIAAAVLASVFLGADWAVAALGPDIFALFLAPGALAVICGLILQVWRRCDRCKRPLFTDGQLFAHRKWFEGRERDYRARKLLGSYRSAAIVSAAFGGELRCQWCNHEDGKKPDYTLVSP